MPKRRLDVGRAAARRATGKRVATQKRHATRRLLLTPAIVGVLALVSAGVGSVAFSQLSANENLAANYRSIAASYTASELSAGGDFNLDISRDFDRDLLIKQSDEQAKQRERALRELTTKANGRAKELKFNQWVLPVTGYRLTGRFGQRSSLWSTFHTGLDMAGPSGTTIVAMAAGTVKSVGYAGPYGQRTVFTLLDGTEIWYNHQSRIVVKEGDKVKPGQITGYTGSTGNVTGPHLHLEVRPGGGSPIDPEVALPKHGIHP
ncbi:hypothetical protein BH09ACT10_BH09ACT10_03800 [soil metagenome]